MSLSVVDLQTLSRLLDVGLALDGPARASWLGGLPAAETHLAPRLRELLAVPMDGDGPLAALPCLPDEDQPSAQAGEAVGPYRLLRALGRGGMGEVWLAERADGAFERQVALKLPRQAVAGELAERLRREVQLVARLEHPHIARLYDTGTDARGHPYIAMEYVDGLTIDRFVRGLALAPRLRLFVQVLQAVGYAHGRLVLHLDLKPANVLVSADGMPHLLDFGIAALLVQGAGQNGAATTGPATPRALTPRYAAPEQAAGAALGVQADVYALGVMLGELLAELPPKPELAAIVAKAAATDVDLRYASVEALANDIQRFLRHEPVSALRQGPLARAAKALRRHWVGAGAAAGVLALLLAGTALYGLHLHRLAQAAERERVVKSFVAELFTLGAPSIGNAASPGPSGRGLDDSARLIQARFAGQPALQADLFGLVGAGYTAMGAGALAVELLALQVETLNGMGAPDERRAQALLDLAEARLELRQPSQAEPLLEAARGLAGATDTQAARSAVLAARAAVDLGRIADAARLLAEWDARADAPGADASLRAWADAVRAELLLRAGRMDAALGLMSAAAARVQAAQSGQSLVAAALHFKAARWALQAQRFGDAKVRFEQGRAVLQLRGGLHAVRAAVETAAFWNTQTAWANEVPLQELIVELQLSLAQLRALGDRLPSLLVAEMEGSLATILVKRGEVLEAVTLIEPGLDLRLQAIRVPQERVALLGNAGVVAMHSGRHALADQRFRARREVRLAAGAARPGLLANDLRWIVMNASMAGWTDAALQVLDSAPAVGQLSGPGFQPQWYEDTLAETRARVLLDAGQAEAALKLLRGREPNAQDSTQAGLGTSPALLRGEALCLTSGAEEGLAALRRVHAQLTALPYHPHAPQVARVGAVLGLCALRQGQRAEARALAAQARVAFTAQAEVSPYYKAPWLKLEAALQQR